jgi:M6 family metalloprotease-like protein
MKKYLFAAVFSVLFTGLVLALPPAPGMKTDRPSLDKVRKLPDLNLMRAKGFTEKEIAKATGTTGNVTIVAIFVNFTDVKFTEASGDGGSIAAYTAPTTGYFDRFINYYKEVSYNQLDLTVTAITTTAGTGVTLSHTMGYYGAGDEANTANGQLFIDAVSEAGISKADGYDYLLVVHAGIGNESYNNDNYIWSLFTSGGWNAGGFLEGLTVPGKEAGTLEPFGVLCHEFGHQLGLPDLYSTDGSGKSNVGSWDLMDYGAWLGTPPGSKAPHFCSWCKIQLNWITPSVLTSSSVITVKALNQNSADSVYKLPILGSTTEYFLIEYRRFKKTDLSDSADAALPGEGILVFHIDDSVGSISGNTINNNSTHLRVDLEEQDNQNDINENKGEAADVFSSANTNFFAAPQSDSYLNNPSGITLSSFSGEGNDYMTALLAQIKTTSNLAIQSFLAFPNPAKNAANAKIRAVLSRPFTSADIKIYNLAGDLVASAPISISNLNITASETNNTWVYDYIWDLKNQSGSKVGSGLYFYVFSFNLNGQKQAVTGKAAVVK